MTRYPLLAATMFLLLWFTQPTPPLVGGEAFYATFDHTVRWYQESTPPTTPPTMVPCTVTPPAAPCVPDTTTLELLAGSSVLASLPASALTGTAGTFAVPNGLPAGTHAITVRAVGAGGVASSAVVTLVVDPAPIMAPSPQGAPTIARSGTPPSTTWTEITVLRGSRAAPANSNSATLAYPGTVVAGTRLVVAGAAWGSTAPTSVAVTGSGAGCPASFTVRLNTTVPAGVTWRTFVAQGSTTTAGPCTVTVDPSGTANDFSWTQTGFTGPATVTETVGACQGNSNAPSCTLAGLDGMLIVGVMSHDGPTMALTAGAGVVEVGEVETNASMQAHAAAQTIRTVNGSAAVGWNMASPAPWSVQVIGWK